MPAFRLPANWRALARRLNHPGVWLAAAAGLVLAGLEISARLRTAVAQPILPDSLGLAPEPSDTSLAFGIFWKLGLVLLLAYGVFYVLRRWPSLGAAPRRRMTVLETTRLAPRQALHLVRAGDRTYLIGATDQNISLLSEVTLPPAEQPAGAPAAAPAGLDFSTVLAGWLPPAGAPVAGTAEKTL